MIRRPGVLARVFDMRWNLLKPLSVVTLTILLAGCQPDGGAGGAQAPSLFGGQTESGERWTIRAIQMSNPGHQMVLQQLAEQMRNTPNLQPAKVRLVSDATSSTIYYGEYIKVPSKEDAGRLVFPPEYQRDLAAVRGLIVNQQTPCRYAEPELVNKATEADRGKYDVANCPGNYTLYIARFYNTPTFNQRKQSAEQYVELLRQEGFPAYYRHEELISSVFAGDFDLSDVVEERDGRKHYSARVERFIARKPEEFKYVTENGHVVLYDTGGQKAGRESVLIPVPRPGNPALQPDDPRRPGRRAAPTDERAPFRTP